MTMPTAALFPFICSLLENPLQASDGRVSPRRQPSLDNSKQSSGRERAADVRHTDNEVEDERLRLGVAVIVLGDKGDAVPNDARAD